MKHIEDIYPLSPMQQGMLFDSLYAPHSGVYVEQLCCTLGGLDIEIFQETWRVLIQAHPVLRTIFLWEKREQPLQIVRRSLDLPWMQQDWRAYAPEQQQQRLHAFLLQDRTDGFELNRGPLVRLALFQIDSSRYYFIWSYHHILLDGWSSSLLLKDVLDTYISLKDGRRAELPMRPPFRTYIHWLQQQQSEVAESYWRSALAGVTAATPLGLDYASTGARQETRYGREEHLLSLTTSTDLRQWARQQHLTLNTIFQGIWAILLSRYSGEQQVLFGTTVSGRPASIDGVEQMLGLFINTLPMRVSSVSTQPVKDWLHELQIQQAESRQYEYCPLVQLQGWSEVPRGQPLFESLLVFENYPVSESLKEWDNLLEIHDLRSLEQTSVPLTISVAPGEEILLQIEYDTARFERETIKRILGHSAQLVEHILISPEGRPALLPILTPEEHQQIVYDWNDTQAPFPADTCVHHLIEAQVERTPHGEAVVAGETRLSYRELNTRANQLAHYLQAQGIGPEVLVGIYLGRTADLLVAILGVLKAGGGYVPLDPTLPLHRLNAIVEDAHCALILTHEQMRPQLPEHFPVFCLDSGRACLESQPAHTVESQVSALNTAFVVYTSGSTGRPKGVLLTHQGLLYHNTSFARHYMLSERDRIMQFCALGFDTMAEEIFPALEHGATIVMRSNDPVLSIADFIALARRERITILDLPTAYWHAWTLELARGSSVIPPETVRWVIVAGEKALPERYALWHQYVGARTPWSNTYGPAEATILTTIYEPVYEDYQDVERLPIGRPWENAEVYVLDAHWLPVPVGVIGELSIGCPGLARGYLNQPELTAQRFIPHPFRKSARLYRTGDLARYLPDGKLEYIGRIDQQIKLRGFRIEIEEIEAALRAHAGIQEAFVLLSETEDRHLVAYLVAREAASLTLRELRDYLRARLPAYMIPAAFYVLSSLPYNTNGKVDRRRLPHMQGVLLQGEDSGAVPLSKLEQSIACLWQQLLPEANIGRRANFFEIGGHSLLVIRAQSRLQELFHIEIPLVDLFTYATLGDLAQYIEALLIKRLEEMSDEDAQILVENFF